jgi:hypothetical protein
MSNLFYAILNSFSIFSVVAKRLKHHLGLSISSEIGIISVLSLVICVPVFTNAVLSQVLKQALTDKANSNHRSLFSLHAYYLDDSTYTPVLQRNAQFVSQWLNDRFSVSMGLKVDNIFLEMNTEVINWKPVKVNASKLPFEDIYLYIMGSDIVPHKTRLVEGQWPPASYSSGPIPVAVFEDFADNHYLNVGDIYRSDKFEIQIVGIFRSIRMIVAGFTRLRRSLKKKCGCPWNTSGIFCRPC